MSISVIIVSYNRPFKLQECLNSLTESSLKSFSVVVLYQDHDDKTREILQDYKSDIDIISFPQKILSKSKSLNFAISLSNSKFLAFTDDDCIIHKNWLKTIVSTFNKYPQLSGIYGFTQSYQAEKNTKFFCPSVHLVNNMKIKTERIVKEPKKHWKDLGFGNNMAFRREVFEELGGFKEWLGPGSIGCAAEDGEIALRCLVSKKKLYYNPKMIVYHNRWLTKEEYQRQELSYICGEMACYGYYAFQGYSFGQNVVKENIVKTLKDFKAAITSLLFLKKGILHSWRWFFLGLYARLRGIFVGFIFFLREKYIYRLSK